MNNSRVVFIDIASIWIFADQDRIDYPCKEKSLVNKTELSIESAESDRKTTMERGYSFFYFGIVWMLHNDQEKVNIEFNENGFIQKLD